MGILLYSSRKLFERIILPTEDPNLLFSINTCCNEKGSPGGGGERKGNDVSVWVTLSLVWVRNEVLIRLILREVTLILI